MKSSVVQNGEQFILRPGLLRTQKQIAQAYDISDRAVRYWVVDGMPRRSDRLYDLIEIQRWKSEKKLRRAKDLKDNTLFWHNERMKYKALLMEVRYLKKSGKLVRLAGVEEREKRKNLLIEKSLFAFPRRVSCEIANVDAEQAEAILSKHLQKVIEDVKTFAPLNLSGVHVSYL